MKTRTLFFIFSLFSLFAMGQEVSTKADTVAQKHNALGQDLSINADTVVQQRNNVFKFLPANLIFNSLSFEYERKFSPKSSFILGVGLSSPKTFASKFNLSDNENKISNDNFGVMSIRAAYRHYGGHHVRPVGFYFSPYLKYQKLTATAENLRTITETNTQYQENYDVSGNTLNFGIQWGVQFLIAKRVCVDFYFLGIEAGLANLTATVTSPNPIMIDEVYNNVKDNVSNLPSFFADKITVTKKTNQVEVKGSSMPYPWLRSGISIGLAF